MYSFDSPSFELFRKKKYSRYSSNARIAALYLLVLLLLLLFFELYLKYCFDLNYFYLLLLNLNPFPLKPNAQCYQEDLGGLSQKKRGGCCLLTGGLSPKTHGVPKAI